MDLEKTARNIRINIIKQIYAAGSGHPGGALSAADILTLLYFEVMNIPSFTDENRDRFVMSKGHASALLYATLAQRGAIDLSLLPTFRKLGSPLQGHPDMNKVTGVDMTAGSLGLGVSAAAGMALAAKLGSHNYRVYTLLGDGELQEGSVWETFMAASHYKLDNFTVIIDNNNLQIDGEVDKVMSVYPLREKLEAFGFDAVEADGHDFSSLRKAFAVASNLNGKPCAIIAKTIKGKGVSFMENNADWHGKAPDKEQAALAVKELGGEL